MNLCSDKHDEVCYETHNCPVCEALERVNDLERQVRDLEEERDNHVCECNCGQ